MTEISGDGSPAKDCSLYKPIAVSILENNQLLQLYISDQLNQLVRVVFNNNTIATVAGNGTIEYSDNVPAINSGLNTPNGIAVSSSGELYIPDNNNNNRIRKVLTNGIITTIAGNGGDGYSGDGGPAINA